MTNKQFRAWMTSHYACPEAMKWLGDRTPRQAWLECPRGDWLLSWAAFLVARKLLVWATCDCVRLALKVVPSGDLSPLACIKITEAWCDGKATLDQVRAAARAATHVGRGPAYAVCSADAVAACCAAEAAYVACPDAAAAHAAAYAAEAAEAGVAGTAGTSRRKKMESDCAGAVRIRIGWKVIEDKLRELEEA